MHERQLMWLQRNHGTSGTGTAGRSGMQAAGEVAPKILEAARRRATVHARTQETLVQAGGAELLAHASMVSLHKGVLTFQVSEPAVMYHLRLCWEQWVRETLNMHSPELGVHQVRFVAGRA